MPGYDKRRLRQQPKRYYGTTDLQMPDLLDANGKISGPRTREIIKREIDAAIAGNVDDADTDTASEGDSDDSDDFVVDPFAPGLEVLGQKKVLYCNGATENLTGGFNLSVYTDKMQDQKLVSLKTRVLILNRFTARTRSEEGQREEARTDQVLSRNRAAVRHGLHGLFFIRGTPRKSGHFQWAQGLPEACVTFDTNSRNNEDKEDPLCYC